MGCRNFWPNWRASGPRKRRQRRQNDRVCAASLISSENSPDIGDESGRGPPLSMYRLGRGRTLESAMVVTACPDWTDYRKKNGLDPLGMQNTSVALYQRLLPGISNVTLRMRYYGFYAWLSGVYVRRIGDTNPKSWQRFVRRAEALYALAAQTRGGEI